MENPIRTAFLTAILVTIVAATTGQAAGKKYQWYHPWFKTTMTADSPPPWPYRVIEERANVIIVEVTPPDVQEKPTPAPPRSVPTYDNRSVSAYYSNTATPTHSESYSAPSSNPVPVSRVRSTQSPGWRVAEAGVGGAISGGVFALLGGIGLLIWFGIKKFFTEPEKPAPIAPIPPIAEDTEPVIQTSQKERMGIVDVKSKTTKKTRVAIVVSILWPVIVFFFGIDKPDVLEVVFWLCILPVALYWGVRFIK